MKKLFLAFLMLCYSIAAISQLNMELRSQVSYDEDLNDVWGWTDPENGVEYAVVGVKDGVSIVSLADLDNATEVAFIPGAYSTWRDAKDWGNYVYVTNETDLGLLVVDMSFLPDSVAYYNWQPEIEELGGGVLKSIHNIFIDEFGFAYLAGSNLNNGGVLYVDVHTDSWNPEIIGWGPPIYSHDVYARDNQMYSSEIYAGVLGIYDVEDKTSSTLLASQETPYSFTHNSWLNKTGDVILTTDERADAPVAAYDISDLEDIKFLDEYRPAGTLGNGVIPHNVQVWDDWVIISYYTDGGRVVDISRPDNLVEVGNFDTFFTGDNGFDGAWGAYPYFSSQTVLLTDISNGLYVLTPTYVHACWLEGLVKDATNGQLLAGVNVEILSSEDNLASTDFSGVFKTGQATAGNFEIRFSKSGYLTKLVSANLQNDEVTLLDVELEPSVPVNINGIVVDEFNEPIEGAQIVLVNDLVSLERTSDTNGAFSLNGVLTGDYDVVGSKWGYVSLVEERTILGAQLLTIQLKPGYTDDFSSDQGWSTSADNSTTSGFWERVIPEGTDYNGTVSNTGSDLSDDFGRFCFVTGNGGGSAGSDDVDNGSVRLTSPPMNLENYGNPLLSFSYWFFNEGGNGGPPDDSLSIYVSNDTEEVLLDVVTLSSSAWRKYDPLPLKDYINLSGEVKVSFLTSDRSQTGHIVEAAIDGFSITNEVTTQIKDDNTLSNELNVFPNPFQDHIQIELSAEFESGSWLEVSNSLGQTIEIIRVDSSQKQYFLGEEYEAGVYMIRLYKREGLLSSTVKIVKQ